MFRHCTLVDCLALKIYDRSKCRLILTIRHDVTAQKTRILAHESISLFSRNRTGNTFSFDRHVNTEVRKLSGLCCPSFTKNVICVRTAYLPSTNFTHISIAVLVLPDNVRTDSQAD
jgi:hypothetical protein